MDPDSVAYHLARAGAASRAAASEELARVGLHPGQEFLLGVLFEEQGGAIGALAAVLGVEPPTVTKMVRRLVAAGLVERRADADDARVTRVYLTAAGRALEEPVRRAWSRLEQRTAGDLDADEQDQLCQLLDRVRRSLRGGPSGGESSGNCGRSDSGSRRGGAEPQA